MKVIFGGVRGSSPVCGPQFSEFGGDTTSVLVCGAAGERIVIDAGTGARNLPPFLGAASEPVTLLLTHLHHDHLMGLTAFAPLYQKQRPLTIVGPVAPGGQPDTRANLSQYMGTPYWPIELSAAGAQLTTHDVSWREGTWLADSDREFLAVGALEVRACAVNHPDGCLAWRIDEPASGAALVFATDLEWGRADASQRSYFANFCRQPRPLSWLVMDGQFTQAQYETHAGWGHSTLTEVATVGAAVGAREILATHHDPGNDDETLREHAAELQALVGGLGCVARASCARQGQELEWLTDD